MPRKGGMLRKGTDAMSAPELWEARNRAGQPNTTKPVGAYSGRESGGKVGGQAFVRGGYNPSKNLGKFLYPKNGK